MEEFIQRMMPEMVYNEKELVYERFYDNMQLEDLRELGVFSELLEEKIGFYPTMRLDRTGDKMRVRLWNH